MLLNVIMASLGLFSVQLSSQKSLAANNTRNTELLQSNKAKSYKAHCVVTAYTPYPKENGGSGYTRMGHKAKKGLVAVDPRVIPMGSTIYIEGYGWAVADDTGGKIRGNTIDVCLPSRHLARRWGRKKIEVIIYPSNNKVWRTRHKP